MRCYAHILNLVVSDGLKEMSYAISSIRNAVRYVRSSPARLKRFKEACKDVNVESKALLCLDVVTRWNSTYMMLEAALKFKKAFRNLEGMQITQKILEVQVELNDMKSSIDELMSKMAGSMQLKFDKYWGNVEKINLLQYIASILDPRFKLDVVHNGFRYLYDPILAEKMIKKVENMMTTLYAFYKGTVMTPSSSNDQQASQSVTSNASGSSSSLSFLIKRRNGNKYPIVSHIARDVLAVQMSTVASESTFSTGGRILDPFRSSLSPKMVEALICSKNWLTCEYDAPIVLRQYMDEIEGLVTSEQVESAIYNRTGHSKTLGGQYETMPRIPANEKEFWMVVNDATMVAYKLIPKDQTLAIKPRGPPPELPPPQEVIPAIEDTKEEEEITQLVCKRKVPKDEQHPNQD
ncbi:zinc finger BED domain-containing protein RICESLEEPER 2-like [Humulus lupulus]|uniref:zinc finger BED domain-containing protein RICESLEEPER 2-like n=1 Tax=Humulus lupulus TaxID=3486 RepID=UPI002B403DD1|nr:zinc finger BED domain-containing protein RICESLEEPER 2-like [Humulus lupulus]